MPKIHHTAIWTTDVDASLRFWCEGLGLVQLMDMPFEGDWPALFDAPSSKLRAIFLGEAGDYDSGIIELISFDAAGANDAGPPAAGAAPGFFLVSLTVDVTAVLARLDDLGIVGDRREISVGGVRLVAVTDPNGIRVELMDHQAKENLDRITDT